MLTVNLPPVVYYCEHEPIQVLVKARKLTTYGQELIYDPERLAEFGIGFDPAGSSQMLQVFSDVHISEDLTFELEFSATVAEELSWANDVSVIVRIQALPVTFDPTALKSDDAPKLDIASVSASTLQMMEDESGAQFLSPIVIDCSAEWS